MDNRISEMQTMLERLAALEKQNRRLRRAGALILAGVGVVVLTGQVLPKNRTVEAERFVLTDANGKSRAELSLDHNSAQLALYDQEGRQGVSLTTDALGNTSTLNLYNRYGLRVAVSAFLDSGAVSLAEKKEPSDWQYHFELADHGAPDHHSTLSLWNAKGKAQSLLAADATGPSLELKTSEGPATVIGSTALATNPDETRRTSAASVVMLDKEGKVLWHAP
jgi:hypothetical protein